MNGSKAYVIILCDKNENVIETRVFTNEEDYNRVEKDYLSNGIKCKWGIGACGCGCAIYKMDA